MRSAMKLRVLVFALMGLFTAVLTAQNSPKNSMPCMEGMVMPGCAQSNPPAQHEQHQDMHNMPGMQMGQQNAQGPDTHATRSLQEPENPGQKTGSNLPAPELLKDIPSRPSMSLAEFMQLGDANNPTLKQANALVRRSQQQARQAGLYPDPSIGYLGEQIRGGSFGGGEQGGFVQQTVVLGGKLGLRRDIFEQQSRADQI